MILYFSGTGNSKYAAEMIKEMIEDEVLSLNERIHARVNKKIETEKPLVFVTPVYAWRMPRLVEEWILKSKFCGNTKAYFVLTCGDSIGNAGAYLKKLCSKKKWCYMGCAEIVMPENYIAMFSAPSVKEAKRIILQADPWIQRTAELILNGKTLDKRKIRLKDRILSSEAVNGGFYALCVKAKPFYATDNCVSCGYCTTVCPLNNIHMNKNKPEWDTKCTHCMACICKCPQKAIEYGKKTKGKERYVCP